MEEPTQLTIHERIIKALDLCTDTDLLDIIYQLLLTNTIL